MTQAEYMHKLGKKEGELDRLFKNNYTTIEDRAIQAFIKMGLRTYRRSFIKGYKANADTKQ